MSDTVPGQKTKLLCGPGGEPRGHIVFCPGCKSGHLFTTEPFLRDGKPGPVWSFNGDVMRPTFAPSMLVNASRPESRCHSFVRDGQIQFLSDCWHGLKGQTVPLPDVSEW